MLSALHKFLGDACGYNPILEPHSVCNTSLDGGWIAVAGVTVISLATLKLVNLRKLVNYCSRKVKRRAFFLSMCSKCGIKKELKPLYKVSCIHPQRSKQKFSTFGGWCV